MSHHSTNNSSHSHHHSNMEQQHLIKLRVELFQFERTTIEVHLDNYLEKIQRQHPSFIPGDFKMLQHHEMLSFVLLGEISHVPAFSYQTINVQLVQQNHPSRVFFIATLADQELQFPNAVYPVYHEIPGTCSTILKMDSKDGFLPTPPLGLMAQNQTIVSQFSVSILLENLSFSTAPFQKYTPVEIKRGYLYFPQSPNHHQGQNPVQQTHIYNHMPMFPNPPPPMDPPRLVRNDNDTNIQWNSAQQSYIHQDRDDLVKQVRQRLGKNDPNSRADASRKENVPTHQSPNVSQSSNTSQQPGPVIGNLNLAQQTQNEYGLQQSSDQHQQKNTTKGNPEQLNPLMRTGFLNVNPPDNTAVANGPPTTKVFNGSVPSNDQGAVGGSNMVQLIRREETNIQKDDTNRLFSFDIPSYTGDPSNQVERLSTPRMHLYRNPDPEIQMVWDYYNLYSTNQPAKQGKYQQYVHLPPLAQSDPKYPQLPSIDSSPYGSQPNTVSAIDQAKPVTPPTQIGNNQANPVTPSIQTGNLVPPPPPAVLGPPPLGPPPPPPAVTQITTGDSLTMPALIMTQPATNVPIPDPMSTGARPKTPPIPGNTRVTRSTMEKPNWNQELVNAGKNLIKSKSKKRDMENSRSASKE